MHRRCHEAMEYRSTGTARAPTTRPYVRPPTRMFPSVAAIVMLVSGLTSREKVKRSMEACSRTVAARYHSMSEQPGNPPELHSFHPQRCAPICPSTQPPCTHLRQRAAVVPFVVQQHLQRPQAGSEAEQAALHAPCPTTATMSAQKQRLQVGKHARNRGLLLLSSVRYLMNCKDTHTLEDAHSDLPDPAPLPHQRGQPAQRPLPCPAPPRPPPPLRPAPPRRPLAEERRC